jgi:hypothetical protein
MCKYGYQTERHWGGANIGTQHLAVTPQLAEKRQT